MKYSLKEMLDILKSNKQNTLKLGDTMSFELYTGEKVVAEIIGFNHDKIAGRKAKAKATFRFTIDGEFNMNDEWTNKGGWKSSKMRKVYCQRLFKLLPEELQAVIEEVEKETTKGNASTDIVKTKDRIFLLSLTEATGEHYWGGYVKEGEQYELFKKKGYKFNKWVWLRSPYTSHTNNFYYVTSNGSNSNNFADFTYGVCFAFAI